MGSLPRLTGPGGKDGDAAAPRITCASAAGRRHGHAWRAPHAKPHFSAHSSASSARRANGAQKASSAFPSGWRGTRARRSCAFARMSAPARGGFSLTPERRAFDRPMAIACFVDRAPCFPSRMCSISSRTNSPACVLGDLPLRFACGPVRRSCVPASFPPSGRRCTLLASGRSRITDGRAESCARAMTIGRSMGRKIPKTS